MTSTYKPKASLKNIARKFSNTGLLTILGHVFTPTSAGLCVKKLSKSDFKGSNMAGCKTTCPVTEEKTASVFED